MIRRAALLGLVTAPVTNADLYSFPNMFCFLFALVSGIFALSRIARMWRTGD